MSTTSPVSLVNDGNDEVRPNPRDGTKPTIELDVAKLHSLASEQQEQYLFTFVTTLERCINSLSQDAVVEQQAQLKRELFKVINLQSPLPTRIIRNSIGRCFKYLFTRGDGKLLFETVKDLGDSLNVAKGDKDLKAKHAAVHCLGEIYSVVGNGVVSVSSAICLALSRLYKSASNHCAVRAAIYKAFCKLIGSVQALLDENIARDIWKQARSSISSDRGASVQIYACKSLEQLFQNTSYFDNISDLESLKGTIWKVGDSPIAAVRVASASCLAALLVKAFTETSAPESLPKTPKLRKTKKVLPSQTVGNGDAEDSDTSKLGSPTWKKNSIKLELSLKDILGHLSSQYLRGTTTNRGRAAIISCYVTILRRLKSGIVETNFGVIADHLLIDILSNATVCHHRHRLLLTRQFVQKILGDVVGRQILAEVAQINAAKYLINDHLKNYPRVLKERSEPDKHTLTGALNLLASFIHSLGSAFTSIADGCREALIQVLQHPSYTVQIHASYCLRLFTLTCPQQIIQCASICMNCVNRELGLLNTGRWSSRRCVGYANGLAAVLSISTLQPLYSSLEISSRILQQAIDLLKSSGDAELRISATQVQVAWILLSGLLSIGPNFVKIHLPQLLLLWRNALPKALNNENIGQRTLGEVSYLVHVRDCALGSILSFLEFNGRLLTNDVSRRIAAMLHNSIDFVEHLPAVKPDSDMSPRITPSLQLPDLTQMARRRILQCFARLAIRNAHTSRETIGHSNLLAFAASCFADPEGYSQRSFGASIANSVGTFESIWNVTDNYGYGISGLMRGFEVRALPGEKEAKGESHWYRKGDSDDGLDRMLRSPICGSREHDSVCLHIQEQNRSEELPDPPATEVVNSAIALFAMVLPLQGPKIQESMLEQLNTFLSAKRIQRDPGRKAAITINISLAILATLKISSGETAANPGSLKSPAVEKCLEEILRSLVIDPDPFVRHAAYEAFGRLCNGAGNAFTTNAVNSLVETIVLNREPSARAGCAMTLGYIHSSVGGMAAGLHLRKIHGVLMSLCSDPHPTVHFWAVEALAKVAESAGLTFSGYIPSTLGLLAQLWISDSHSQDADSVCTCNSELELPTPAAIANTIACLINVLGPDLQDMSKTKDLILTLVHQFDIDDLPAVQGQALKCWQHVYLYTPGSVDAARYVRQLQRGLNQSALEICDIAVDGLYSLMQRDAENILSISNDLEDQIWSSIDGDLEQNGIRRIVEALLDQTSLTRTSHWIARAQEIMTKSLTKPVVTSQDLTQSILPTAAPEMQDEEVAGFALESLKDEDAGHSIVGQELLRWQIRAFALQCLREVLSAGAEDLRHNENSPAGLTLQQKVSEIIRLAFLASTSTVVELRLQGMKLIDQVLTIFGKTPDPDFSEALLLEQYQAQISSALTPAFGADSSPELASAAVNVCATFVAAGLVTDVERMGRILKLLVVALASFTNETGDPIIGDLKGLSTNAQIMVKMAVLSAWADIQVASTYQSYLVDVIKPYIARLSPLWLSSLQDFARLRFEPDISSNMTTDVSDSLDIVYAALNRQTLLKFYEDSWLKLIGAISSLIDQDSPYIINAVDGKDGCDEADPDGRRQMSTKYSEEPTVFFFVLFGICFEALISGPPTDSPTTAKQTVGILQALRGLFRPSVAGNTMYRDRVFSETIDLLDRLALTQGLAVQGAIVEIVKTLCLSHPSVTEEADGEEHLSDDVEQLFELTRIIVLIASIVLPSLGRKAETSRHVPSDDGVRLITSCLEALVTVADVFPTIIQTDLYACILHMFTTILGTSVCQESVVPKALPIFRRFVQDITEDVDEDASLVDHLRSCLRRLRFILSNAQRREAEASLVCARNTLMASVILLTSGSRCIVSSDPLVFNLLDDLLDCLHDLGLGKVAANCMRSLLLTDSTSDTSQIIARFLFERLLWFVMDDTQEDPENARDVILNTLVSFCCLLKGARISAALYLLVPALFHRALIGGKQSYKEIGARLFALAGTDHNAFKGVVAILTHEQRMLLEEIVKEGTDGRHVAGRISEDRNEPSIALKLTFKAS